MNKLETEKQLDLQMKLLSSLMYAAIALLVIGQTIDTIQFKLWLLILLVAAIPCKIMGTYT